MYCISIGIDPGLEGAIVALKLDGTLFFWDTPTHRVSAKSSKREYDFWSVRNILAASGMHEPKHVYIERQQAMPKQGLSSTFKTGLGFGMWLGMLAGLEIPYTVVTAVAWKKTMMAGMSKEKGASIIRAKQLFPTAAGELSLKKHHGRADALLIAAYGRQTSGVFQTNQSA
jgi:crossover junction endodeoxyribonuclease RuvC